MTKKKQILKKLAELTERLHDTAAGADEECADASMYDVLTTVLDVSPLLCAIVSPEYKLLYMNPYTKEYKKERLFDDKMLCDIKKAFKDGELIRKKIWKENNSAYDLVILPFRKNGISAVLVMANEVIDEHRD